MAKVVIIYPRETDPPVETNSFRARMPRYGVLSIASHLAAHGHSVRVFCELTGANIDWPTVAAADFVCFSFLSYCAKRAYSLARRVRGEFGKTVIIGGSHVSVLPEEALDFCDYVIRNEGEAALLELLDTLMHQRDVGRVGGLSYRDGEGKIVHNPDRQFDADLAIPLRPELIPEYRSWGLSPASIGDAWRNAMPRVALPILQASRGCPHACLFCVVRQQLGARYRKRPIPVILDELAAYRRLIRSPYVYFADNDLAADPEFSLELFQAIQARFGADLRLYLFCRLAIAREEKLLRLLERFAGVTLGIGFEALSDEALAELNKPQHFADIQDAVGALRNRRLDIHGLFIVGNESDPPDVVRRCVDFAVDNRFVNIALTPPYDFPGAHGQAGQPRLVPDHLLIHRDWRFFSGNFVVHFPKRMRPGELQQEVIAGYDAFTRRTPNSMVKYLPIRATAAKYVDYLSSVESTFYDHRNERIEDRVAARRLENLTYDLPVKVSPGSKYWETIRFLGLNAIRPTSWRILSKLVLLQR